MPATSDIFLAVGGVFLVTWYGISRMAGNRPEQRTPPLPGSAQYRQSAQFAIAAEFAGNTPLIETLPGGSVFCPDCRVEFPAGTIYCECGAETAELEDIDDPIPDFEFPKEDEGTPGLGPSEDGLVCIYIAENTWKASLLTSILENNDIPSATTGNAPVALYSFSYSPMMEVKIMVLETDAEQARELIKTYLGSGVD